MDIFFCMKNMDQQTFLSLPGVRELIRNLECNQIYWAFKHLAVSEGSIEERQLHFLPEDLLVVTDSMSLAGFLVKHQICSVGYQEIGMTGFFEGAELVLNSYEGLDAAFFLGVLHRFHGLAVVIARTKRLIIRESLKEDFEELYQISREQDNDRYTETMSEKRQEAREKFLAYITCEYRFYGFGLWTVEERSTGRIVGRCGLFPSGDEMSSGGRIELGYLIGSSFRRKGYAYEAGAAILHYAFAVLGCPEIAAIIHRENIPSQKLAEKLGFHKTEILSADPNAEMWIAKGAAAG